MQVRIQQPQEKHQVPQNKMTLGQLWDPLPAGEQGSNADDIGSSACGVVRCVGGHGWVDRSSVHVREKAREGGRKKEEPHQRGGCE